MPALVVLVIASLALGAGACSERRGIHPDADFGDTALNDAGSARDAHVGTDAFSATRDAHVTVEAGRDAGSSAHDAGRDAGSSSGGLDPRLAVPPSSNPTCADPRSMSECPGVEVCRFYSPTEGRCEGCTACGNLYVPCTTGDDCDILFVCFMGHCTNFCTLGTSECGAPSDCIDIGHPTQGACMPH